MIQYCNVYHVLMKKIAILLKMQCYDYLLRISSYIFNFKIAKYLPICLKKYLRN
jgi:hypothetical protein